MSTSRANPPARPDMDAANSLPASASVQRLAFDADSPEHAAVERGFHENFTSRGEIGAAVCIWQDGREILHLTGGTVSKGGDAWAADTLVPVWSCTKGPAALTLLLALHEAGFDLDTQVQRVWPELRAHVTFGEMLSHQSGLCALDAAVPLTDREAVVAALAAQQPAWTPGTAHGYHPRTFGFLVDECVRRITGHTTGEEWQRRIAQPLEIDFHIGLAPQHFSRVATLYPGRVRPGLPAHEADFRAAMNDPASLTARSFASPRGGSVADMNKPDAWQAGWAGHGGIGSARGLAKFYSILAAGGRFRGTQVIPEEVIRQASTPILQGMDRVLRLPTRFAAGFMLDPLDATGAKLRQSFGPSIRAFGHPGAGGSLAFADPDRRLGFAYVMNQMELGVLPGAKADALSGVMLSSSTPPQI